MADRKIPTKQYKVPPLEGFREVVKIKWLYTLLVCTITISLTHAQRIFKPGDAVYCWARNGTMLWNEPSVNGKQLSSIPFKAALQVSDTLPSFYEYADFINSLDLYPIKMKGRWIKVIYKDVVGYVFDGYLSKLVPAKRSELLEVNYGKPVITKPDSMLNGEKVDVTKKVYGNALEVIITEVERCESEYYLFKNISFEEFMNVFRIFFEDEKDCAFEVTARTENEITFGPCDNFPERSVKLIAPGRISADWGVCD